jgi:hypothetical protein
MSTTGPHLQIKLSGTSHSAHDKQKTDAEEIKESTNETTP